MINSILISTNEKNLIRAIEEVGFGELLFVEILDGPKVQSARLKPRLTKLIELIRDGHPSIESIKVHQGEPVTAVVEGQYAGVRFKKKIQL